MTFTHNVRAATPSVVIPVDTFVSVVPAPRITALAVRFHPVFVTVPDPAGVLQVPSHLKNVVAEGVPVAFILAAVTVAASIVQVAPLPVTVISPLSPSDTAPDITISPAPKIEVEFIVFMFVADTRVA